MAREPTALEKIRQLRKDMEAVSDAAKDEALDTIKEAIEALNYLGYKYELIDTTQREEKPTKAEKTSSKTGACPICNFETDPHHDGRQHRSQKGEKRQFTDQELEEKGLKRLQ